MSWANVVVKRYFWFFDDVTATIAALETLYLFSGVIWKRGGWSTIDSKGPIDAPTPAQQPPHSVTVCHLVRACEPETGNIVLKNCLPPKIIPHAFLNLSFCWALQNSISGEVQNGIRTVAKCVIPLPPKGLIHTGHMTRCKIQCKQMEPPVVNQCSYGTQAISKD